MERFLEIEVYDEEGISKTNTFFLTFDSFVGVKVVHDIPFIAWKEGDQIFGCQMITSYEGFKQQITSDACLVSLKVSVRKPDPEVPVNPESQESVDSPTIN